MLRRLLRRIFWSFCPKHRVAYASDFCPQCTRAMVVRLETREIVSR